MSEARRAAAYEKQFPGAVADESQRSERQERLDFKAERQTGGRTTRQRGIVVPDLPWRVER